MNTIEWILFYIISLFSDISDICRIHVLTAKQNGTFSVLSLSLRWRSQRHGLCLQLHSFEFVWIWAKVRSPMSMQLHLWQLLDKHLPVTSNKTFREAYGAYSINRKPWWLNIILTDWVDKNELFNEQAMSMNDSIWTPYLITELNACIKLSGK